MMSPELQEIRKRLQSQDEEVRLGAVRELRGVADCPLDWLLEALGDVSWRIRKEAVSAFLWTPPGEENVRAVIDLLYAEENAGLRNAAMEILVRLGRQTLPQLHMEVASEDHDVRKFVVDILGEIRDRSSIPVLTGALRDEDENVRNAAAENLGKLGATEAIPALLDAMEIPDVWFRFTILDALGHMQGEVDVGRLLKFGSEPLLRKALFDCFARIGDERVIPLLTEGLSDAMRNVRESAATSLAALGARYPQAIAGVLNGAAGESLIETVQGFLHQSDPRLREAGVWLLAWIGSPAAVQPLLELVEDEQLGRIALGALQLLDCAHITELITSPGSGSDRSRAILCYLAGEKRCAEAFDFILAASRAESLDLSSAALRALGTLGDLRAAPELIRELRSARESRRQASSSALAQLGSGSPRKILEIVQPLLQDREPEIRMAALEVAGALVDAETRPDVERILLHGIKDVSPEVRRAAIRTLGSWEGRLAVQPLRLALMDEDPEVRALAAETLGRSSDEDALESLAVVLHDDDMWVRAAVVRALAHAGAEYQGKLVEALDDPVGLVVITALEGLSEADPTVSRDAFRKALDNEDDEVVRTSLRLLARHGFCDSLMEAAASLLERHQSDTRSEFLVQFAGCCGPRGLPVLESHLPHEHDEQVREILLGLIANLRSVGD